MSTTVAVSTTSIPAQQDQLPNNLFAPSRASSSTTAAHTNDTALAAATAAAQTDTGDEVVGAGPSPKPQPQLNPASSLLPGGKSARGTKKLSPKEEAEQREFERKRQLDLERTSIIASVFANAELATKKESLHQYMRMYETTAAENERLARERQNTDSDAQVIVEFLRNEIGKLQAQIKEMRVAFFSTIDEERSNHEKTVARLNDKIQQAAADLAASREDAEHLRADLEALAAFRREKESLQRELYHLKERLQSAQAEHEREISLQRFATVEEKIRVKAIEKDLHERFEREVEQRAIAMLDPRTKRILRENEELLADKEKREGEIEQLEQDVAQTREEAEGLRRDLSLAREAEQEIVKKSAARAKKAEALQEQVDGLEARMTTVADTARRSIVAAERDSKTSMQKMQHDRDQAVNAAHILQRDLINMRRLSSAILQQRTDTETFFLDALNMVRAQIAIERANNTSSNNNTIVQLQQLPPHKQQQQQQQHQAITSGRRAVPGTTKLITNNNNNNSSTALVTNQNQSTIGPLALSPTPPSVLSPRMAAQISNIPAGSHNSTMNNTFATAGTASDFRNVDISSLSWEDKERVLRALFAKIQAPFLDGPKQQPNPAAAKIILASAAPAIMGSDEGVSNALVRINSNSNSNRHAAAATAAAPRSPSVPSSSASSSRRAAGLPSAAAASAASTSVPALLPSGRAGGRNVGDKPPPSVAALSASGRGGGGGGGNDASSSNNSNNMTNGGGSGTGVLFLTENPGFGDIFNNVGMRESGAEGPPMADEGMFGEARDPDAGDDDSSSSSNSGGSRRAGSAGAWAARPPSNPDGAI